MRNTFPVILTTLCLTTHGLFGQTNTSIDTIKNQWRLELGFIPMPIAPGIKVGFSFVNTKNREHVFYAKTHYAESIFGFSQLIHYSHNRTLKTKGNKRWYVPFWCRVKRLYLYGSESDMHFLLPSIGSGIGVIKHVTGPHAIRAELQLGILSVGEFSNRTGYLPARYNLRWVGWDTIDGSASPSIYPAVRLDLRYVFVGKKNQRL
ncbi:MAG: hypothetical protein R2813_07695 [Flavobacteriales bacterium]